MVRYRKSAQATGIAAARHEGPPGHARTDEQAISVALCTFNGQHFLREQIRSICWQTLPPVEIVLSDDASHDGSVATARKAVAECAIERATVPLTLRVLRNAQPLGITQNFEQAVRACRHGLIVLSDQDDIWQPERLQRMALEFARRPELLLLHSDAALVDAAGKSLGNTLFEALEVTPQEVEQINQGRAFEVLLRRNLVTGATVMLRRSLLQAALPFPKEWLHDEWLAIIAAALGSAAVLAEPLIQYRQHSANQVGASQPSLAAKFHRAFAARGTGYQIRLAKALILEQRLVELAGAVTPATLDKIRGKVAHQRFRAGLPNARLRRLLPVLREGLSGRYGKFGRGPYNVVRDLFEPA